MEYPCRHVASVVNKLHASPATAVLRMVAVPVGAAQDPEVDRNDVNPWLVFMISGDK